MPNYTKLFNSIVTSTIWTEDDKTRIIWITMLALADQNGEVHASIPGLARVAGVSVESTQRALESFLGPDEFSRTKDFDGRRIVEIDGGWELLNHAKYRLMASKEDAKESNAKRQQRHREREKKRNATVTPRNATVTEGRDIVEADAYSESKNIGSSLASPPSGGISDGKSLNLEVEESKKPDSLKIRVGKLRNRRPTTHWTPQENKAFKAARIDLDDLEIVERFYAAEEDPERPLYRRTSLSALLNHWNGEVD